jgi:hypothetical protein
VMTTSGQTNRRRRWRTQWRPSLPMLLLVAANVAVLATVFPSFYSRPPAPATVRASATFPPYVDDGGISQFINLGSLNVTSSSLGWGTHVGSTAPLIGNDRAERIALDTASASALLPVAPARGLRYRLLINTETMITLSSPQWPARCVCWMMTVVANPSPPLALACVAANPPIGSEEAVILIDAMSGRVMRESLGGGLPWAAGGGCPLNERALRLR